MQVLNFRCEEVRNEELQQLQRWSGLQPIQQTDVEVGGRCQFRHVCIKHKCTFEIGYQDKLEVLEHVRVAIVHLLESLIGCLVLLFLLEVPEQHDQRQHLLMHLQLIIIPFNPRKKVGSIIEMSVTLSNCQEICNSPLNSSKAKMLYSFPRSQRFRSSKKIL